jgi:hypothetical protein
MRTALQLDSSLTKIVRRYSCTGFIVKVVMIDQEFDKFEDKIDMVEINTTAACARLNASSKQIRSAAGLWSQTSHSILPQQVIIHLVYFAVLWLNSLSAAAGV